MTVTDWFCIWITVQLTVFAMIIMFPEKNHGHVKKIDDQPVSYRLFVVIVLPLCAVIASLMDAADHRLDP